VTQVRRSARGDLPRMAQTLAAAFSDDPVLSYLLPPGVRNRRARLLSLFGLEVPRSLRSGGAWTTDDGAGAAVWYPPGQWHAPWTALVRSGLVYTWIFRARLPLAARVQRVMEGHHPREPHWYLFYVAARPGSQDNGIGSALLDAVLAECDAQNVPAYVEATCEQNRRLYLRHGFHELDPLPLPGGGPVLLPMWRNPGAQ
jgi:ribosomal protein S18 acetylase RimI-like enzyme